MSQPAIESIQKAMNHWTQAKKVSPPCPVFTAAAIASYDEALVIIKSRKETLQAELDKQR